MTKTPPRHPKRPDRPAGKPRPRPRTKKAPDRQTLKWSFGGITISVRLLVAMVVVGVLIVAVVPTAFQWLQQEQAYRSVVAEVEAQKEQNKDLEKQLADWDDEAFIASQARERLGFVRPGETQFVVADLPQSGLDEDFVPPPQLGPAKPWAWALWDALRDADDPPPVGQYSQQSDVGEILGSESGG